MSHVRYRALRARYQLDREILHFIYFFKLHTLFALHFLSLF